MTALLAVTSTVDPAVREAFDHWYETEHIPDAQRLLEGISRVTRWRSTTAADQVVTVYEFGTAEQVQAALAGEAIKDLIAEFDRLWAGTVSRARAGFELVYVTADPTREADG